MGRPRLFQMFWGEDDSVFFEFEEHEYGDGGHPGFLHPGDEVTWIPPRRPHLRFVVKLERS